ncbi:MAG: alpha/beta fold hydrolase [Pyrinomonadaceae bacterium]
MKIIIRILLSGTWLFVSFQPQSARGVATDTGVGSHGATQTSAASPQVSISNSDPQPRYTSRFVTVNATRLHYIVQGTGRPVVFIHGNPGSGQDWMAEFLPLASRHKVVAFDRPGHGRSQRPKHGDATIEAQAQLLHDALAQSRVERPVLVGHSWGAALALIYAINYPNEVAGLVVVAPAVYESHDGSFLTGLPSVPVIGDAANYVLTPLIGASVVRSELKKAFSPDPVPKKYLNSVLSEWMKPSKVRAYALDDDVFNSSVRNFSPRYAQISVPISILTGDADLIVSRKENAERLHEALPRSRLIVLPKTGHQIPFTRPQTVIDEIERILRLARARR